MKKILVIIAAILLSCGNKKHLTFNNTGVSAVRKINSVDSVGYIIVNPGATYKLYLVRAWDNTVFDSLIVPHTVDTIYKPPTDAMQFYVNGTRSCIVQMPDSTLRWTTSVDKYFVADSMIGSDTDKIGVIWDNTNYRRKLAISNGDTTKYYTIIGKDTIPDHTHYD